MFNKGSNANANGAPATGMATGQRFHFMTWLRGNAADLLIMAAMGAVGLGVYKAPPAPSRSFPVNAVDGTVVYPQFAYPIRKEVVPIWLAALIAFIAPFFFFCVFQARRRSAADLLATTMGLLRSLVTAAVFQVFLKWLIGGLRPHFLAACQPKVPATGAQSGNGFQAIMYDRSICTGDVKLINDSLESFPSGHSTAAFAGLIFLALYINAQLKVMSAHTPAYWTMVLFFAPVLGATLIAGALTIDEFHNWYDVLAGAVIGTATALVAFRQTFAAVWDFRFNHLLLPRAGHGADAFFTYQHMPELTSGQLPVTRAGGWGVGAPEAAVGAPGDATVLVARMLGGGMGGGMGGAGAGMHGGMGGAGVNGTSTTGHHQYMNGGHHGMADRPAVVDRV